MLAEHNKFNFLLFTQDLLYCPLWNAVKHKVNDAACLKFLIDGGVSDGSSVAFHVERREIQNIILLL